MIFFSPFTSNFIVATGLCAGAFQLHHFPKTKFLMLHSHCLLPALKYRWEQNLVKEHALLLLALRCRLPVWRQKFFPFVVPVLLPKPRSFVQKHCPSNPECALIFYTTTGKSMLSMYFHWNFINKPAGIILHQVSQICTAYWHRSRYNLPLPW